MPKIKKVKKIPPKIKEVKPISNQRHESDLEEEIEKTEAQKEVEDFVEFVSGATREMAPGLEQGELPQPGVTSPASTGQQSEQEDLDLQRTSYEEAGMAETYTTSGSAGSRIRERNLYNPSIRQTPIQTSGDVQTTPAQLADREIRGQSFIGQEKDPGSREMEGSDGKKSYRPAHEGG